MPGLYLFIYNDLFIYFVVLGFKLRAGAVAVEPLISSILCFIFNCFYIYSCVYIVWVTFPIL
jgi:hypothetical protein